MRLDQEMKLDQQEMKLDQQEMKLDQQEMSSVPKMQLSMYCQERLNMLDKAFSLKFPNDRPSTTRQRMKQIYHYVLHQMHSIAKFVTASTSYVMMALKNAVIGVIGVNVNVTG
ncbi:hypothetical protein GPALN_004623 [Globodera pallida]|nr:hypothetical protein GPALN_004623 [Globodera pallida]